MTKSKSNHSKKISKIFACFILILLIFLTVVLIIFVVKKVFLLNDEINSFRSGEKISYSNKILIADVQVDNKINNLEAFKEEKYFSLSNTQQNFDDLSFKTSPDGSKFAYITTGNGSENLYVNAEKIASSEKISFIDFSFDGKRLAYGIKINNKDQVILDGQPGQVYDWIFAPYFFTPDNRYFIYKARKDEGDVIVFNTTESRPYDKIYPIFLTNDKKQLIFYARTGSDIWKTTVNLDDLSFK